MAKNGKTIIISKGNWRKPKKKDYGISTKKLRKNRKKS